MKQITDDSSVKNTHTYFFDVNIKKETDKAFLIEDVLNSKGALTTAWVPKSRCKLQVLRLRDSRGKLFDRFKYWIPNFFIK